MLVCAFFCTFCTRDRGCSAHPVFPAPSVQEGKEILSKTRAQLRGGAVDACRHSVSRDCPVSISMAGALAKAAPTGHKNTSQQETPAESLIDDQGQSLSRR